jgi:Protein of unknown function (DUF2778)
VLGAGVLAFDALGDEADSIRPTIFVVSAGIAALAVGIFLGAQIPIGPGARVASLETELASEIEASESSPKSSVLPRDSFDLRFAGLNVPRVRAPEGTVEAEEGADGELALWWDRTTDDPPVGRSQPAPVTLPPLAGAPKKRLRAADLSTDADVDSHTAIYDIAAHTVYLPDGRRLEAHSGLGGFMDDARHVHVKDRGPTPPNVYDLTLRERTFHGVRAIRLNPVDGDKMFGRDGMLAHTYMLGPSGQSNGCVSFSDYPVFLNAFLKGEINRLVVVERLPTAPDSKTASRWIPEAIKDLLGLRRS